MDEKHDGIRFNRLESIFNKRVEESTNQMVNEGYDKAKSIQALQFTDGDIVKARNAIMEGECYGPIEECQHLTQLREYLISGKDIVSNITSIMDHFNHLLTHHDSNVHFEYISKTLGACDITKCQRMRRHYRDRSNNSNKNVEQKSDFQITPYDGIIDKIHCHFTHSYDIGYRNRPQNHDPQSVYSFANTNRYRRHKFNQMHTMQPIQSTFSCYSMGQKFWYWAKITGPTYDQRDDVKNWIIHKKYRNMKDELTQNLICPMTIAQFKHEYDKATQYLRCKYFKTLTANEQFIMSSMFKPLSNFNIKNNSMITLEHLTAMIIYCGYTALSYEFSKTFRRLDDANNVNTASEVVDMDSTKQLSEKEMNDLKIQHLRRKHDGKESDDSLKDRNSNFYHLSRYLIESVNIFSKPYWLKNTKDFKIYHGVSEKLTFNGTVCYMHQPLSTTSSWTVAVNFSDDNQGLIVELSCQPRQRYFDCRWVSDYPSENELLFMFHAFPMRMVNITDPSTAKDYGVFIQAISIIESVISARQFQSDNSVMMNLLDAAKKRVLNGQEIDNTDPLECGGYRIPEPLKRLTIQLIAFERYSNGFGDKIDLELDPYVVGLLHGCCRYKEQISIECEFFNVETFKQCHQDGYQGYKFLKHIFCEESVQYDICNVGFVCSLFPNTKVINIGCKSCNITSKWMEYLLHFVKTKPRTLICVILNFGRRSVGTECEQMIDELIKQYSKDFTAAGWKVFSDTKSLFISR
eukprot:221110_1